MITRAQFDALIKPLIDKCMVILERCITKVNMKWDMIDKVIMVGGSSLIPAIRSNIQRVSQKAEIDINLHLPQKAISFGAALHANALGEKNGLGIPPIKQRVASSSLGIKVYDPKKGKEEMEVFIPANSPLPAKFSKVFYTHRADQIYLDLIVAQEKLGYDDFAEIGMVKFGPIENPYKGYPLEISLECNINGVVQITAKDAHTNKKVSESMIDQYTADNSKLEQQLEVMKMLKVNSR
jgi:molecular chaperone DnaK (HSP70)